MATGYVEWFLSTIGLTVHPMTGWKMDFNPSSKNSQKGLIITCRDGSYGCVRKQSSLDFTTRLLQAWRTLICSMFGSGCRFPAHLERQPTEGAGEEAQGNQTSNCREVAERLNWLKRIKPHSSKDFRVGSWYHWIDVGGCALKSPPDELMA